MPRFFDRNVLHRGVKPPLQFEPPLEPLNETPRSCERERVDHGSWDPCAIIVVNSSRFVRNLVLTGNRS